MGSIWDRVFPAASGLFVKDMNFSVPVHHDDILPMTLNSVEVHVLHSAVMPRFERRMFLKLCSTSNVKCSHGELGSRFTDGLSCNDTHGLAYIDEMTVSQVPSVAPGADALF